MLGLALASLRNRKSSAIGAFVALFCAAAMVSACGALLATGLHGAIPPERYAGTPVIVTADQQLHWTKVKHKHGKVKTKTKSKSLTERAWLPASVGATLDRIPGSTVVADRSFPAEIVRPDGQLIGGVQGAPSQGHGWSSARLTPYRLVHGTQPRSAGELVVGARLAARADLGVGDRVVVQSTDSPRRYTVSGIARSRTTIASSSALFFDDSEAARLARHGQAVTAYGVFGVGADQVGHALRDSTAQVSTGEGRGSAEFPHAVAARTALTSMGGAIGGTSLIVAMLVVVGTFSLSTQQRHRELALLRAVGATPRQVRRMISREALMLGVVASLPGALAGLPLARAIRAEFVSAGVLPEQLQLAHGPLPVAGAVLVTVAAGVLASRVSARRTRRIRPVEALAESTVERRELGAPRVVAGLVVTCLAALVTFLLTVLHTEPAAQPVTYLSVLLWMVAIALLGPLLARAGVALLGGVWRLAAVGGFLAGHSSRRSSRRVASVITPLALLVGVTTTLLFVPVTISSAAQAESAAGLKADYAITAAGPGVPAAAAHRLDSSPGVHAVTSVAESTIWIAHHKHSARGVTPRHLTRVMNPDVVAGSLSDLADGRIAMSTQAAQGHTVGDRVRVTLPDGTAAGFRLVAVYDRRLGFGDALVPFDTLARHRDNPLADQVLVTGTADESAVRASLHEFPGMQVTDRATFLKSATRQQGPDHAVSLVFLALVVTFAAIAVVNTLAMSTLRRSGDLSLLRLIGATARQVLDSLRWELGIILAIAMALGTAAAWLTLTGFSIGMVGRGAPTIEPLAYAFVLLGATLLGAVAMLVPARALLRRHAAHTVSSGRG